MNRELLEAAKEYVDNHYSDQIHKDNYEYHFHDFAKEQIDQIFEKYICGGFNALIKSESGWQAGYWCKPGKMDCDQGTVCYGELSGQSYAIRKDSLAPHEPTPTQAIEKSYQLYRLKFA